MNIILVLGFPSGFWLNLHSKKTCKIARASLKVKVRVTLGCGYQRVANS